MSRFESSDNAAAAARSQVCMAIAVDLDFPAGSSVDEFWAPGFWATGFWAAGFWVESSGHVRLHDGPGELVINGSAYSGTGQIQLLDKIEESIDVIARPVRLTLSGVDPEMIALARAGGYQGRQATIYLVLFDPDTGEVVDTPEVIWEGHMDTITIRLGQGEASMTVKCEHRLRREPRIARYTDADQKLKDPTDRFFDLLGKIPGFRGKWGARDVSGSSSPKNPGPSPKYPNFRAT